MVDEEDTKCSALNSLHSAGTHWANQYYPWVYDAGFCCRDLVADGDGKLVPNIPISSLYLEIESLPQT